MSAIVKSLAPGFAWLGAVLLVCVALAGGTARAQSLSDERAIRAWVDAVDASDDWSASFRELRSDPSSGSTQVSGLSVRSRLTGMDITFEQVIVVGAEEVGDGFAVHRLSATGGKITAGLTVFALSDLLLDDLAIPAGVGFAWDPRRPFTSTVKAYGSIAGLAFGGGRIGSVRISENVNAIASHITYENVVLGPLSDGLLASVSAGPLRMDAPSEAATPNVESLNRTPLVTMEVARAEADGIDLDALVQVFDGDRYADGTGDLNWRPALQRAEYRDVRIAAPGVGVTMDQANISGVRVRQPRTPPGALLDLAMLGVTGPEDPGTIEGTLAIASAFAIGEFSLAALNVDAVGIERFHLADLTISDLSADRLGAFAMNGFEGAVADQASVQLGRLAFGGIDLAGADAFLEAIRTASTGGDVDLSALAPTLGFLEADAVDVDVTGLPRTRLDRMRVALDNYVNDIPTTITAELDGADVATLLIPERRLRELLMDFGYERVRLDADLALRWRESEATTSIDTFRLAIADVGALSGSANFQGPTRGELESLGSFDDITSALSLENGEVTFRDDSIVGRALAGQAERVNIEPEKFREQFSRGLPFMLTFLGNREFQAELTPVLQTFIQTPGSITFAMAPPAPVAIAAIMSAARSAPFSLPDLLAISVSGEAGPEPPQGDPEAPVDDPPPAGEPPAPADDTSGNEPIRRTINPAE